MSTIKKVYDTYQFFQINEGDASNIDRFTVMVEDMGDDCM